MQTYCILSNFLILTVSQGFGPQFVQLRGEAHVGGYGLEFFDRVGNAARRGREGADCGLYTTHKEGLKVVSNEKEGG